jgi:DNA-binding LacI/PurR family transcriptional regulator
MTRPRGSRVTLTTVADRVGVSRSTVSNAYNHPDQLSAEMRRKILEAADELGYAGPDPAARQLRQGRAGAIGLVQKNLVWAMADAANQLLLAGVAEVCEQHGLGLVMIPLNRPDGSTADVLRSTALDGVIAHCEGLDPQRRKILRDRGMPLVIVDGVPDDAVDFVGVDDIGGAEAGARHLVELGHRRIAIVGIGAQGDTAAMVARWRLEGYQRALADVGLRLEDVTFVEVVGSSRDNGRAIAPSLLGASPRPTAILAMSDEVAAGVLDVALELGIDVPGELSIVGFDDSSTASLTTPKLTTIHQDHRRKGYLAAQMLLDPSDTPRHEQLGTNLVVRGSTATAPPS